MKRLLCCFLALMIFFPFAAGADTAWTEEDWALITAALSGDTETPVPPQYRLHLRANQVGTDAKLDPAWKMVLLMSSDAPDLMNNFGRADVLVLCAIHEKTGEIRLLSLPEDASIAIAEFDRPLPLRFVNCFGGPLLTLKALNHALGLNINRYCAVNFSAFIEIVDALGGVSLYLSEDEAPALGRAAGKNRLSGTEALKFARLRRQGENGLRPRQLLEAIADQAMHQLSFDQAMALIEILLPALDTNLTVNDLMDLCFSLLEQEGSIPLSAFRLSAPFGEEAARECHAFLFEKGE